MRNQRMEFFLLLSVLLGIITMIRPSRTHLFCLTNHDLALGNVMTISIMQGAILRALLALATVRGLKVCLLRGLRIGFPIRFVTALRVSLGILPRDRVGHLLGKFEAFAELNELSSGVLTGVKSLIDHVLLPRCWNSELENLHNVIVVQTLSRVKWWELRQISWTQEWNSRVFMLRGLRMLRRM